MVKTPRTRHSKVPRDPVTIELEPGAVSRVAGDENPAMDPARTDPHAGLDDDPVPSPETMDAAPSDPVRVDDQTPDQPDPHVTEADAPAPGPDPASPLSEPEPEKPFAYEFERADEPMPRPTPEETPAPKEAIVTPTAQKRSGLSLVAAGIVGGVVTLAGAGVLQYAGLLGAPGGAAGETVSLTGVETDIAALRSEFAALKESAGAQAPDLSGTVEGLSQGLDQVKADVAALQQAVQSIDAGGTGTAVPADVDARLKALESSIAALGQAGGTAAGNDIAALGEKMAAVEALAKSAGDAGAELAVRLGGLEQGLSALSAKVEAQAGQPKVALAIAAAALKSAVERGAPFQAELETFAAVAPEAPELAALRPHAEQGVATRADLLADVDATAKAIIAAANPPRQDAGFFERLLASAESLVTVRPIGAVAGDGVPEKVARMEVALKTGDLAKALAEFDSLPDEAKAAAAGLGDKIRARVEVERLVDQAVAAAMKA